MKRKAVEKLVFFQPRPPRGKAELRMSRYNQISGPPGVLPCACLTRPSSPEAQMTSARKRLEDGQRKTSFEHNRWLFAGRLDG